MFIYESDWFHDKEHHKKVIPYLQKLPKAKVCSINFAFHTDKDVGNEDKDVANELINSFTFLKRSIKMHPIIMLRFPTATLSIGNYR